MALRPLLISLSRKSRTIPLIRSTNTIYAGEAQVRARDLIKINSQAFFSGRRTDRHLLGVRKAYST